MSQTPFDYKKLSDEELVELSASGDRRATEVILTRYKNLVLSRAKAYFLAGADHDDVVQEGMIGLFKAVRDFDVTKQASFCGFAEICIKRQMITAVKASTRQKHMPLNSYVSLSEPLYDDDSERALMDMLAGRESVDPEAMFLRREKAEMINYRKRKDEDVSRMLKYKDEDLILEFLPIIDNFESAIKMDDDNLDDEVSKFLSGFKMIYGNLISILEKFDVKVIDGAKKPFDPSFHQAVMTESCDMEPGMVIEVLRKGYMLKDKVLRPAMVIINE